MKRLISLLFGLLVLTVIVDAQSDGEKVVIRDLVQQQIESAKQKSINQNIVKKDLNISDSSAAGEDNDLLIIKISLLILFSVLVLSFLFVRRRLINKNKDNEQPVTQNTKFSFNASLEKELNPRPASVSRHVIKETEKFITNIARENNISKGEIILALRINNQSNTIKQGVIRI